ncbi:flavin reductase [Kitasatospora sp. MMS16-BH015]|uniref:flavin reductase family protein n=1 Tax=Kitasatospora sp. MMS16-BH015 TaxID=2018025 RepID=UPI000CA13E95|nr:flavin reductase family protein [Kitasatospora sp. MMS16-BH015]AUG80444.1 flavin reductase [Kitasatospora sp. MMS16-BH015]
MSDISRSSRLVDLDQPTAAASLREVMARFATGVVVLTVGGESVHGMTATAFSSVSLEPPMVLCCVAHSAVMHQAVRSAGHFAVSLLGVDQEPQARYFADKQRTLGPAQFATVRTTAGARTGAPLLDGALGWLECELVDSHLAGDHTIFVGSVLDSRRGPAREALLHYEGTFRPGAREASV